MSRKGKTDERSSMIEAAAQAYTLATGAQLLRGTSEWYGFVAVVDVVAEHLRAPSGTGGARTKLSRDDVREAEAEVTPRYMPRSENWCNAMAARLNAALNAKLGALSVSREPASTNPEPVSSSLVVGGVSREERNPRWTRDAEERLHAAIEVGPPIAGKDAGEWGTVARVAKQDLRDVLKALSDHRNEVGRLTALLESRRAPPPLDWRERAARVADMYYHANKQTATYTSDGAALDRAGAAAVCAEYIARDIRSLPLEDSRKAGHSGGTGSGT